MRFDSLRQLGMPARRLCGMTLTVLAVAVSGCADGFAPLTAAPAPEELVASAVRPGSVRLTWRPVKALIGSVVAYVIERRTNIDGQFIEIGRLSEAALPGDLQWFDTDVAPETIYGYRVTALTEAGDRSPPSVIGGVVTPPPPGIQIVTTSTVTSSESLDPDGYNVMLAGPDTVRAVLGTTSTRRFSPLKPGRYTVTLSGIIERCSARSASQEVEVTDTTATTITPVQFELTCRDPNRGELVLATAITGDSLDPTWSIDVLGQASDTTLPPAQRVFSRQVVQTSSSPSTTFTNLLPGTYNATIRGIEGNCALQGGAAERSVTVTKLGVATVNFAISCVGSTPPPPPASTLPFIWRNRWTPRTAAVGATVELEQTLDLSARPSRRVTVVQAVVRFNPAVLRYEEVEAGQLGDPVLNARTPGELSFVTGVTGAGRAGVVNLGKFIFTVIGAAAARSEAVTTVSVVSADTVRFRDSVQVVGDTFTVSSGTNTVNQPPVAQFTGPIAGTVGTPVTFNGTGSSDPDGTIASYAWAFGDNTTAAIASPSKTYTAAGTYNVVLTVTDNRGATATRSASITITAGTTPPPPGNAPVARANGPYTAQAGVPLTLSSAGSTNATSFSWALGNGQTATGASPSVTYAAAGTYTIVLTVTGANGTTNTSQATVTVSAAPPPPPPSNTAPLLWQNIVQAYDAVNNIIALQIVYDLNTNLPETTGPEALRTFVVDSLKWDPSRLQFQSLSYGPGIIVDGSTSQPGASAGRLTLRGTTSPGLDQGNLVIATIRFRPVGTSGQTTTTSTFLGALIGTSATGSFSYRSKTTIVEGQFVNP